MRLLFDLFPCQTASRFRGIGRYTLALAREMAQQRRRNEFVTFANPLRQDSFEDLRQDFTRLLPPGFFLPYYHEISNRDNEVSFNNLIAECLVRQAYEALSPDFVMFPNLFEGWGEEGVIHLSEDNLPSAGRAAIVYDVIPYIFPNEYLNSNPDFKKWYLQRVSLLSHFNILLAISEATRQDTINHLGINPDNIVNISGAVSSNFQKINFSNEQQQAYLNRFGISRPFVLYIGGNNPRKNMEGTLRAYSKLPREIIETHQLVINDVGDETVFLNKARMLGLDKKDFVITGRITDEEIVALYNLCKLFVFPSLYEGFGLPVLEAMSCGAPAIASNNSSLPEIVGRNDALFDASQETSITSAIYHALNNTDFLQDLSLFGQERAKAFSWENSAKRTWEAIEETQRREQGSGKHLISIPESTPRSRIAFVSPLPPQKSGIAFYSAELLPYLSRHFDIDLFVDPDLEVSDPFLVKNFDIYPWTKLIERRDCYATVLYHHGNSHFHAHMFDLEQQFPGVVVLHDFFVSNLLAYIPASGRSFAQELENSHGLKGLIEYYQEETADVCKNWPINWEVLKNAQELIVHSSYHRELLDRYYRNGWKPTCNVIKLMHSLPAERIPEQVSTAKRELGIEGKFVFSAFGLLAPEKLNLELITAFAQARPSLTTNTVLVFVGDFASIAHASKVRDLITKLGLEKNIIITGFVDEDKYKLHLASTDVAIQLRTNSRGETSSAVLDCMAYGLPTIINANGTFDDYSPIEVLKLTDPPEINEISQAMILMFKEEGLRKEKGLQARKVVSEQHDPAKISQAYADVINKVIQLDERKLFAPLFDKLAAKRKDEKRLHQLAGYAAANFNNRNQSRLLIDVSFIARLDYRSGIQRVVKSLVREFIKNSNDHLIIELIRIQDGRLFSAYRVAEIFFELSKGCMGEEREIPLHPGDTLFMLDSSWDMIDQFLPVFNNLKSMGGKIISMVYDLIPIYYPEFFTKEFTNTFKHWLETSIIFSDQLVCISKFTADSVATYLANHELNSPYQTDLAYFHLGSEIEPAQKESSIRQKVRQIAKLDSPYFLMVGTIEPRKGHNFVLDAFEQLWKNGMDYCLCITGKMGWREGLEQRILTHNELGKHLFYIENPTDAEINLCYDHANALIMASTVEGFGLPIVEASLHHIPVILSDIPVFREIADNGATFYSLESPANLAAAVKETAALSLDERQRMIKNIQTLSWKESAGKVLEIIKDHHSYIHLSGSKPMKK